MTYFAFLLMVFLVFFIYQKSAEKSRKNLALRFNSRLDMPFDLFYEKFYKSSGIKKELIEELLNHVAAELELPVLKLLPSDRFDFELAADKGWEFDSGHGMLGIELQRLAKKKGKQIDCKGIATLDDYLIIAASIW